MHSPEEVSNLIKEKYLKVKELLRTKDPETAPYKSSYEAKELLCEMKILLKLKGDENTLGSVREKAKLAGVYYLLGTVFMATEETACGEEHLFKSYHMLEDSACHPDNVLCATACLNQIGMLLARTTRNEDALTYLHKAVEIYKTYTNREPYVEPVSFVTIFANSLPNAEKNGTVVLEKTHTLSLYYIAQVYTALELREKGARYCFETLRRQIESNDYEYIDWSVNAATMSQVLVEKNAFREARHHLAAAMFVLNDYETNLIKEESQEDEAIAAKKEELVRRKSDVLRCWIKYCIMLLSYSKDRLMSDEDSGSSGCEPPPGELVGLCFPSLTESLDEDVVTCNPILTFEDARPVFLFGQKCCNDATKYYTLLEHASDYAQICMDHSQLYFALSFFEEDEDRQCKILKRRLDLLTALVKHLNPNYYLDICREIWMTLGQICTDMVDLKLKKARMGEPSSNWRDKVNSLVEDGVNYYTSFIKSFQDKKTNEMLADYPKDHEQAVILANLYAARLYSKFVGPSKQKSMDIDKRSLEHYQTIVDYARTHKDVAQEMVTEVKVANDMLLLLPYKLTRMSRNE